jgi:hypothetical protein
VSNHTYLFTAEFGDGNIIQQTQEDKSSIDPNKSQFYDVQAYEKTSPLVLFTLTVQPEQFIELPHVETCGTFLGDGALNINGAWFYPYRKDRPDLEDYKDFRIIYLRNNTLHMNTEDGSVNHLVGYTIGWQVTYKGENVQRIIKIGN